MVGGIVIGITRREDRTMLHVRESGRAADTCCIDVEERRLDDGRPVEIGLGDLIWWQSWEAMWTPAGVHSSADPGGCGRRWDIHLPRVSYSYNMGHDRTL
jgi:hypothetical protein